MKRRLHRLWHEESGITLTELLDAMAILGIILAVMALILSMSIRQSSQIQEQSTLQTEVRATVDEMARQLRQAYSGDATYPIETASPTTLQFLSPDEATPFHDRRIAYRLTGGHLDRALSVSANTDGPPWTGLAWTTFATIPANRWATLVGSVRNAAVFSYYDKSGALLTGTINPTSVYRVQITVTVSTDVQVARQFTYSTSASLRWAPS